MALLSINYPPTKSTAAIVNAATVVADVAGTGGTGAIYLRGLSISNMSAAVANVAFFDGATAATAAALVDRRECFVLPVGAVIFVPVQAGEVQGVYKFNLNWLAYTGADPDSFITPGAGIAVVSLKYNFSRSFGGF